MSYFDQLYNASYNGVPFIVKDVDGEYGRRVAIHSYPYRDGGWIEDLGRKMPVIDIRGFLVGDDVIAQRDFMLLVCELAGPGVLIHPTRGIVNVNLVSFRVSESWDHGRQIIFDFHFMAGGAKLFPSLITSTLDSILTAIGLTNAGATTDFIARVSSAVTAGASVVASGILTAGIFYAEGQSVVKSGTNIISLASSIVGSFGRFAGGSTGSSTGSITGTVTSVGGLAAQVAALSIEASDARSATSDAGAAMVAAVDVPADFATATQNFTSVILDSITDPYEAVNAFAALANFPQPTTASTAPIGIAENTLQSGITDLSRRSAICAMAQAVSQYQPSSYEDADNLRTRVCAIIDSEILIAGDQGEDDTYQALKALRLSVVQDLTARGATLAHLIPLTLNSAMPSLALSYRLYQDVSRNDQLVAFADPIHPAFMPDSFSALSS